MKNDYIIKKIERKDTLDLILNYHYAKRVPSISYAFGLFLDDELVGCVTYGKPGGSRVCNGLVGDLYGPKVYELNRLVLKYNNKNEASMLIANSFKLLPRETILISYADTNQEHIGVVYQATNWMYVGLSAKRTDRVFIDGTKQKHGRHVNSKEVENFEERTKIVPRPRKHRYVYIVGSKSFKRIVKGNIKYKLLSYPKVK